ncbi:PREDICTED: GDSL esterase/lipase At2g30220-like [Nelumbo nucifera]|nr:PREDICTED: GDSL esterase/lipase At2g30220-like [Nelumbo nucifera]
MASTVPFFFFLVIFIFCAFCNASTQFKFPALLAFGDSTVDTGNNNFIKTLVKSNHYPYGREFPDQVSTGRFSDGRLVPDLLDSALGIKEFLPAFLDPRLPDSELLTGVSFASAGSGYDDLTAAESEVIPVSKQPKYFKEYIKRLKTVVGEQESMKIVGEALVLISAGTNDFILNFYDLPTRKLQFNTTGYQDFLQQKLQALVKELYDLGCRKFLIGSLPPIGCIPLQITSRFSTDPIARRCVDDQNWDSRVYNSKLEKLSQELQSSLQGSKVVMADIYEPLMDLVSNPRKYGFVETKRGCCGTGFLEMGPLCNALTQPCENASQYLFWDAVHPGEVASAYITHYILKYILPKLL